MTGPGHPAAGAGREETFLLALGGSSITGLRSPTSDRDYFLVGAADLLARLPWPGQDRAKSDVETRDLVWFEGMLARLATFAPRLDAGPSPFTFWDLRFAARVLKGRKLCGSDHLFARLQRAAPNLRCALAAYMSSFFISTYEDVLGLCLAERYDEVAVLAGELAQRAALVALLQSELVDPAPKWSLALAKASRDPAMRSAAAAVLAHLNAPGGVSRRAWALDLLRSVNTLVAVGMMRAQATRGPALPRTPPAPECLVPPDAALTYCLMGVPGFTTVMDFVSNRLHLCNATFVALAARDHFVELRWRPRTGISPARETVSDAKRAARVL